MFCVCEKLRDKKQTEPAKERKKRETKTMSCDLDLFECLLVCVSH